MKKTIFILGIVSVNIMLFGALLKALHLWGGSILLVISILLFSFGFLPLALNSSYKSQEEKKYKWLYIVTFIVFSFDLLGALFKILHWPYAGLFLTIGLPLPFIVFLPVYLYQTYKFKEKSVINSLGIMFGLTFLAVFSVLLALNVSATVLNSIVVNNYNNENTAKFYQGISVNNSDKDIIKLKSDELCAYIDELKSEVLVSTENNSLVGNYDPIKVINSGSTNLSIFTSLKEGDESKIDHLKKMIGEYGMVISKSEKAKQELKQLAGSLFDVTDKELPNSKGVLQKWEDREFQSANLIIVLDVLSKFQSNVRFIETEYLTSL
jgi:hypothetical protein